MPFISSSYDGSSRRSSGSSVSSLGFTSRGLDRFSSTRKSSVYEKPSTYVSSSTGSSSASATPNPSKYRLNRKERPNSAGYQSLSACPSPTPSITLSSTDSPRASEIQTTSLERSTSKNGTSDSGLDSNYSYLSGSTPSRFSTSASSSTSVPSSNSYSSSSTSTSAPFGITRRDSSTSSYKRSDSGNTTTNGNNYLSVDYPGSYSNSSTLERSSYKPASRSNSTNLFANNNDKDADNTSSSTNNTTVIDNAVTNSSNGNSGSRKQSMDLSNGALDLTRRINETLARHGLDDKRTVPSTYEPPPAPVRFNRNRESKDREILNQYSSPTSPTTTTSGFSTGSWRRNSTKSANSQNSSTAPHSPIPTRFENNKSSENNHYSRNTDTVSRNTESNNKSENNYQRNAVEIPDAVNITALKTVISRSTSPTHDKNKQVRTRVARTTDPIVVEQRRSRKPRVVDGCCQTELISEFGTLADYLNPPPPPTPPPPEPDKEVLPSKSFDYFACFKQHMINDPNEKLYGYTSLNDKKEVSESEDDYYEVKRAPMMMLLPGSRPQDVTSSPTPVSKKISDATQSSVKTEDEEESEYTYETEEEEEEEVEEAVKPPILPPDLESYEARAERVLEEQRERVSIAPELDYIDEEDEDVQPQVTSPKRKKKGTFISGTVDIDDLLAKEQTPTNFALDDSLGSPAPPPVQNGVQENGYIKKHVDFSEPELVISKTNDQEEKPWWTASNGDETLFAAPTNETITNQNEDDEEEEETEEKVEEEQNVEEELEEEEEEEGAGEEEGDWEWEYYEESSKEEEPVVEEVQDLTTVKEEINPDAPWILKGLNQVIPRIPNKNDSEKLAQEADYSEDEEEIEETKEMAESPITTMNPAVSASDLLVDKEKGYKEWLEESAQLHEGAHLHLQAEIEAEEDLLKSVGSSKEDSDKSVPILALNSKASKAARLVEKMKHSEDMDLKRVLFSLKTFFQSDKDLVYEFVKEGGLLLLIDLGEDEEAQLQNLILRALGQIMLYVDGMNGVMENPRAIQFLYKLVLASNPLVCKTAIKLLLVFVEYTENNCLLLIKAINEVDKELGVIPWSNIITTIQNANKDSTKRIAIDTELAMYALTLVNKCLYALNDQDTFYDQTDYMEELNMTSIIDSLVNLDTAEGVDSTLMQQVQLYNVALKQEDGEPVTEEEISYLDEDATESGLRTTLRAKADKGKRNKHFQERKSLRFKTKMLEENEVDSQGDMAGISIRDLEIILAKHGLPTSKSGTALNALSLNGFLDKARGVFNAKISKGEDEDEDSAEDEQDLDVNDIFEREGQAKWEEIVTNFDRPLKICDLDFTDLGLELDAESKKDNSDENKPKVDSNGIPLPPPIPPPAPAPPPPTLPPHLFGDIPAPPPAPMMNGNGHLSSNEQNKWKFINRKSKKTAKLFWKEIRNSQAFGSMSNANNNTIWDDMEPAAVDTAMIEYLFENRAKEASGSGKDNKPAQLSSAREIIVLDHKRSNAINIGMTKLPPPRVIKSAVMKMDSAIMNREGVEKLLTMLPTEEETTRINEAQEAQPDIPLGTAEQFLQTLSTISCLESRLRLWSFKMEFEVIEKEVCEPLMDLKIGIASLQQNMTFKTILNVLLTFGNFLNSSACKGFQLDYLEKVPEVKDTVHKHSLLYHMTPWVLETYPASSDLYSEIGPLTRVSRTDFNELDKTLRRMEAECKNAWDYLKIITRHDEKQLKLLRAQQSESAGEQKGVIEDPNEPMRIKLQEFLKDAAERIHIMSKVHQKMTLRYLDFLTWMGIPVHFHSDYPVHKTCKILSEFALEYRTTRERVIQTMEKKKAAKERKRKERKAAQVAAALAEAARIQSPNGFDQELHQPEQKERESSKTNSVRLSREETEDHQLRLLLGNDIETTENGTLRRKKKHHHHRHHKHKQPADPEATNIGSVVGAEAEVLNPEELQKKFEEREHKREKKSRKHRSSLLEGTLPLTEDNFKSFTTNEMERGLLETLMATSDSSTLKRNKDRRKSVKERRERREGSRTSHEIKRSRTRENNVLEDLERNNPNTTTAEEEYSYY